MKKLKDINWNHLYYFYEVSRSQSLKVASAFIGISSATLSEQLKNLEAKFNKKLLKRTSRGVKLTQDGEKLYVRAKRIFEEGSKVLDEFSSSDVGGYPVKIGIEDGIVHDIAIEISSQYWDLYANYGTVNTKNQREHSVLIENISNDSIDWGISIRKPKRKTLIYEEIESFKINFYCADDLYNKYKDVKDLLTNIPFALTSCDDILNSEILKYLKQFGISPRETVISDHPAFLKNLCQRGRCIMFAPLNPFENLEKIRSFTLETPLSISLYAIWKAKNDKLLSIVKLKELIGSKFSSVPKNYENVDFQIEVSETTDEMLK